MSFIEIFEIDAAGEQCWGIRCIDNKGNPLLESTELVTRAVAISTAKCLKHHGCHSSFNQDVTKDMNGSFWTGVEVDGHLSIEFSLVKETRFKIPDSTEVKTHVVEFCEEIITGVKGVLACAEIRWNPPECDPAFTEKESDTTPIQGHPGS
ncbi:MAG: hypothetical protein OXF84_08935 [Bacteroidetes bacterium]|nr:hypothetical protein [Bacteroidota bacterium]